MGHRRPHAEIDIDAPLDDVWAVMLDTTSYAEWNPFVVRAECRVPPRVGDPIALHVRWADGSTASSRERISVVEAPHDVDGVRRATLAYVFEGVPAKLGLVRSTRYQVLTQHPGRPTHYDTHQELTGPLVGLAGPARITDGFARHAAGLKERCERQSVS